MLSEFAALWFIFFLGLAVLALGEELSNESGHEGWLAGGILLFVLIMINGGTLP